MTLHIFNPEHEIALAENNARFTPPMAARDLADDLSFLPALWAEKGDAILVDDKMKAIQTYHQLPLKEFGEFFFLVPSDVPAFFANRSNVKIAPWGWDKTVRETLSNHGVPDSLLPDAEWLDNIRTLSNRTLAVKLLDSFKDMDGTTGFSRTCNTYEEVLVFLDNNEDIVVKAPWSSSGRGVRYMQRETVDENLLMWIVNTIEKQGNVVAEMKCPKVHDLAVEFKVDEQGSVKACGISVFSTERSAYKGNRLATETEKREWLSQYISLDIFDKVVKQIESFMEENIHGMYEGPFGVDMLICSNPDYGKYEGEQQYLLNPCVEINLRCTMGHVALSLAQKGLRGFMSIAYQNRKFQVMVSSENDNENENRK